MDPSSRDFSVSARYSFDRKQILVVFGGIGTPCFSALREDGAAIPLPFQTVLPDTARVFLTEDGAGGLLPGMRFAVNGRVVPVAEPRRLVILTDIGDTIIDEGTEIRRGDTVVSASCIPGAKETYLRLFREGFPIVMNADGLEQSFRNTMKQNGLDGIFVGRAVSETVGADKPDRRMFLTALACAGLTDSAADLSRAVMIGNNVERDIAGANRMGIRSVLLTWSRRRPFDREDSPPDRHPTLRVGTPEELFPLMLALDADLCGQSGRKEGGA